MGWAEPSDGGCVGEGGGASPPVQLQRDGTQRQVCDPDAGKHHLWVYTFLFCHLHLSVPLKLSVPTQQAAAIGPHDVDKQENKNT